MKLIEKAKAGVVMNDKEIAVMLKVDSPYCVKLFEVYETSDQVQLVLELLDGNDLFSRICDRVSPAKGRSLPYSESEAAQIIKQ